MKLGILGATGWLGRALGLGLLDKGLWRAEDLVVLNRSGPNGDYAAYPGVTWARDVADLCARSDILVLSVRPEDFPVAGYDPGAKLVISFMAGWTTARLSALSPHARLARAMPNGGASTGQSFTPWLAPALTPDDAALIARILSAMGSQARIETEEQLDYLTALSGSGAAYPALMARAFLHDARARGLPEAIALQAVEAVVCGSSGLLQGHIAGVQDLLDAYMSYKGITAAGLQAAEAAGFETALHAALAAATAKARDMGREKTRDMGRT